MNNFNMETKINFDMIVQCSLIAVDSFEFYWWVVHSERVGLVSWQLGQGCTFFLNYEIFCKDLTWDLPLWQNVWWVICRCPVGASSPSCRWQRAEYSLDWGDGPCDLGQSSWVPTETRYIDQCWTCHKLTCNVSAAELLPALAPLCGTISLPTYVETETTHMSRSC